MLYVVIACNIGMFECLIVRLQGYSLYILVD